MGERWAISRGIIDYNGYAIEAIEATRLPELLPHPLYVLRFMRFMQSFRRSSRFLRGESEAFMS